MRSTGNCCTTSCPVNDDLNACADLVRRADPARFRAAMAAPVAARQVLFPLYAFNVEVARAPWLTREPMIAEMRLQWWRDALEEIAAGATGATVRRHEVVTPLAGVLDAQDAALLDGLIAARRWDIYRDPFEDEAHFASYLDRTAGHLMWVGARKLGQADEGVVRKAAHAQGLANWLRAIPRLEAAGRVPLLDGRPEAVRDLARDGLARLSEARRNRARVSRAARPALLPLCEAGGVLHHAARRPGDVSAGALEPSALRTSTALILRTLTGRW